MTEFGETVDSTNGAECQDGDFYGVISDDADTDPVDAFGDDIACRGEGFTTSE